MKKYIEIIMLFVIFVSVVGCSNSNKVADPSSNNSESIDENQPYNAQEELYSVTIDQAPERAFIDGNTKLPSTYPIYINKYAYGQEGPLFEINDEVIAIMTNNLSQFLVLLYGESVAKDCDIVKHPSITHKVLYDNGKSEMWSSTNGISILTSEYEIAQAVTKESLNENTLLKAAVEYLDIENPQIISTIE